MIIFKLLFWLATGYGLAAIVRADIVDTDSSMRARAWQWTICGGFWIYLGYILFLQA